MRPIQSPVDFPKRFRHPPVLRLGHEEIAIGLHDCMGMDEFARSMAESWPDCYTGRFTEIPPALQLKVIGHGLVIQLWEKAITSIGISSSLLAWNHSRSQMMRTRSRPVVFEAESRGTILRKTGFRPCRSLSVPNFLDIICFASANKSARWPTGRSFSSI